jgi:hypothetical protein
MGFLFRMAWLSHNFVICKDNSIPVHKALTVGERNPSMQGQTTTQMKHFVVELLRFEGVGALTWSS